MFDPTTVRKLYRKLLTLYPREFREQMGESMEQTFNDLCREHQDAGKGIFGLVLETFADTLIGILKEGIIAMTPSFKTFGTIIISIIVALAILASAWFGKGTEYENAWFYVMIVGVALISLFEAIFRKKNQDS